MPLYLRSGLASFFFINFNGGQADRALIMLICSSDQFKRVVATILEYF